MFSHTPLAMINQRIDRGLAHILINPAVMAVDQSKITGLSKLIVHSIHPGIGSLRVNSKKPPHLCLKYLKPPQFGQIAEIHQLWGNSLQCALIGQFLQANTISDRYGPLSGLTWRSEMDDSVCHWPGIN
jgi:hypothetical protein